MAQTLVHINNKSVLPKGKKYINIVMQARLQLSLGS